MCSRPSSDDAVIANFRAAHEHQFTSIRRIATVDGLQAFLLLAHWIDPIARAFNASSNSEANWRVFIRRYFPPKYWPDREVRRLYDGLRGALSHELATRGLFLTDDPKAEHWADVGDDHRLAHLGTFMDDCEFAWQAFSKDLDSDAGLRAEVAGRTANVVRPVMVPWSTAAVASTATPTTIITTQGDWPKRI